MENVSITLAAPMSPSVEGLETFTDLCKQLGRRINGTENALLCVRAYRAYLIDHPDTAHGQGNKSGRDTSSPAFYKAAAQASGVSPDTISALLQVGKAIDPLPEDLKEGLASSSLGIRMLRKLAPKKFDSNRETLLKNFIEEDKSNPEGARANLEAALTTVEKGKGEAAHSKPDETKANEPDESHESTALIAIAERTYDLAPGKHFDIQMPDHRVRVTRVEIDVHPDGRVQARVTYEGKGRDLAPFLTDKEESAPSSGEQESKAA